MLRKKNMLDLLFPFIIQLKILNYLEQLLMAEILPKFLI